MSTDTEFEIPEELRGKDVESLKERTPDELRGKTPEELNAFIELLDAHLRSIHQTEEGELRDKSLDEQRAFDYGLKLRDLAMAKLEEHRNIAEIFRRKPKAVQQVMANLRYGSDDPLADVRRLTPGEARDSALRRLDDRSSAGHLSSAQKDQVERQIRRDQDVARRILVTETDAYRSAWMKLVTQPDAQVLLDDEERDAVRRFAEYRAMAEGSNSTGGYGIPVFIDPSIILTDQESDNPFLTLARQVTVNTNKWKGVSAAGVTWAFQSEAAEVADDSPTLAQPEVDIYMARGFIPYSIEVGQDYPAFASEMQRLLSIGYDELLVDKFTQGAGSTEPRGLLTALLAATNSKVTVTSTGKLLAADVYKVWKSLPQKYRRNATWMMSVDVNNVIRQQGSADEFHAFTVNLEARWLDQLFGKTVAESPYMPDAPTTSGTGGIAIVGDFSNFVIARRGGMSVELVPHLFHTSNNRPSGQRGWFAYARIGSNSVNDAGFRLLVNTTS